MNTQALNYSKSQYDQSSSYRSDHEVIYYIDAANVCYWQDPDMPSLNVLLKLLLTLKRYKKQSFYCIFDANLYRALSEYERELYAQLLEYKQFFHQVTPGKRADDYILALANRYNAPVITNDTFNGAKYDKYAWIKQNYTPQRLFMGEVIATPQGDHLMLFDLDINETLMESTEVLFKSLLRSLYPPQPRHKGEVKFFHEKGWGRILYQKEEEIYFHRTSIQNIEGPVNLEAGQNVTFTISENERGPFAKEVQVWLTGTVVHYDEVKELGNIKIDGSLKELFFFKSYFEDPNFSTLYRGQRVTFVSGQNNKGECARHIRLMESDNSSNTISILKDRINHLDGLLREKEEDIKRLRRLLAEHDGSAVGGSHYSRHQYENNYMDNEKDLYYTPPIYANPPSEVNEEEVIYLRDVRSTPDDNNGRGIKAIPMENGEFLLEHMDEIEEDLPDPVELPEGFEKAEDFDTPEKRQAWWYSLEIQWRKAFNVMLGNGERGALPNEAELKDLLALDRISFYRTGKNKLSFKLTNFSGIQYLTKVDSINFAWHYVTNLSGLDRLTNLQQLNCSNNSLRSLDGVEKLQELEYFNCVGNRLPLDELLKVEQLPKLNILDCRKNGYHDDEVEQVRSLSISTIRV